MGRPHKENKMDELIKIVSEVSGAVWKCYKEHLLNDPPEQFWNNWIADLNKMDEALKPYPVMHKLYLGMIKGFADATSEYWKEKNEKSKHISSAVNEKIS